MNKKCIRGLSFCFLMAVPAWLLGKAFPVVGGPVLGILLGMALNVFIKDRSLLQPGVTFTTKKILQYAVILQA